MLWYKFHHQITNHSKIKIIHYALNSEGRWVFESPNRAQFLLAQAYQKILNFDNGDKIRGSNIIRTLGLIAYCYNQL